MKHGDFENNCFGFDENRANSLKALVTSLKKQSVSTEAVIMV